MIYEIRPDNGGVTRFQAAGTPHDAMPINSTVAESISADSKYNSQTLHPSFRGGLSLTL